MDAPPAERTALPLSRGQRLIWSGQQLHPEAPLYNMAFAFTLEGRLDPGAFRAAFDHLLAATAALRTVIGAGLDGEARQEVLPELDWRLPVADLSRCPEPAAAARDLLVERCRRLFRPGERLFDSLLLRLAEERYCWYLCQHHVVTDAWSMGILFRRLERAYEDLAAGRAPALAAAGPAVPPAAEEAEEAARRHWAERAAPETSTPFYGEAPTRPSTRSVRIRRDLGRALSERLRALATRPEARGLTPEAGLFHLFATLLFAYLHRASGRRDLALGAPAHGRATAALKGAVGLLTEVFPLRLQVEEGESFASLCAKVRGETGTFLRHAVPGAGGARQSRSFPAVLNLLRTSFGTFAGHSVAAEWLHPGHQDEEHALRLQVCALAGEGELGLLFDLLESTFDPAARRWAPEHFLRLLEAMVEDWRRPIGEVDLLSDEERARQGLPRAAAPAAEQPPGETPLKQQSEQQSPEDLLAPFFRRAAAEPEAPALVRGSQQISYGALGRRVRRFARELGRRGVGPGSVVGLHAGRSVEGVVMTLAVLRAGGAFLPLEPDWPERRRRWLLADAGASLLLARAGSAPPAAEIPVLEVAAGGRPRGSEAEEAGAEEAGAADLPDADPVPDPGLPAYVLYTSGSSGQPKGVLVSRGSLAAYLGWALSFYGEGLDMPLFTPPGFDLTLTSLFLPLSGGGKVVIYPEAGRGADLALLEVVGHGAVDAVKLTPSHLSLLGEHPPRPGRVQQLIFGGEALTRPATLEARRIFGDRVRIHNEYGPTEATVGCIVHTFDEEADTAAAVPIGRPATGARAYVLDRRLRPLPEGVPGELHLAGAGLAIGYLGRARLTAERFVPDPFGHGGRLYRSGDLARWQRSPRRPEPVLEYLGRIDAQLKIRGARVEPAEVEAALASHPEVEAAVVAAVEPASPGGGREVRHCRRCALPDDFPDTELDPAGTCNHCRAFDGYEERVRAYFQDLGELRAILDRGRARRGEGQGYDCIALFSGGKDSSYMLCRLLDMGYRVLAYTLDNGFLSDQAKGNIQRVAEALGVDHVFGSTPAMNRIFADSLERHANVCQGCFKTLYTLSLALARERKIPAIVTGLSRGQLFETRLSPELFRDLDMDRAAIDAAVLEARKAYHRAEDAVSRLLDVSMFRDDRIFEEVEILDFYRYCSADLEEMLAYLAERVPWVRPTDTGRSTNCLINDVGIYVHKRERGFHNYALPYSWDVRLGHKRREAALAELDDRIDPAAVERMLRQVGYSRDAASAGTTRLAAYYTSRREIEGEELHRHLAERLPAHLLPSHLVRLESLPLNANGKVDRAALPAPEGPRPEPGGYLAPGTEIERTLARVWGEVLGLERVGVRDHFLRLGGDSIAATRVVARCRRAGLLLTAGDLFDTLTIERLAARCRWAERAEPAAEATAGPLPPTPACLWLLESERGGSSRLGQQLWLEAARPLRPRPLAAALAALADRHEALGLVFEREGGRWRARPAEDLPRPRLAVVDLRRVAEPEAPRAAEPAAAELERRLTLSPRRPPLLAAALLLLPRGERLLLSAHHLAVDALSWPILTEDLSRLYRARAEGGESPPPPDTGPGLWARALEREAAAERTRAELPYWQRLLERPVPPLPADPGAQGTGRREAGREGFRTARLRLGSGPTRELLEEAPEAARTRPAELLAAALALCLGEWHGGSEARFFLEGHGREALDPESPGPDASRAVGWLAALYPVVLPLPADRRPGEALELARRELRRIPRSGLGYGLLRRLSPEPAVREALARREEPEVVLNWLGRVEALAGGGFRPAGALRLARDPASPPAFPLELGAWVLDGELHVEWVYDPGRFSAATVEARAGRFLEHLRALLDHCLRGEGMPVRAADFPLANLDEGKLEKLSALLGQGSKLPG